MYRSIAIFNSSETVIDSSLSQLKKACRDENYSLLRNELAKIDGHSTDQVQGTVDQSGISMEPGSYDDCHGQLILCLTHCFRFDDL